VHEVQYVRKHERVLVSFTAACVAFANAHGVSAVALRQTYEAVRTATGEINTALEAVIIVCITPQ